MNLVHILPLHLRLITISFLYYPSVQPHLQSCILPSDSSSQILYSFPVSPLLITCLILIHSLTHSPQYYSASSSSPDQLLTKKKKVHTPDPADSRNKLLYLEFRSSQRSSVQCGRHTLTFHTNLLPLLAILYLEVASSFELLVTICREHTLREV